MKTVSSQRSALSSRRGKQGARGKEQRASAVDFKLYLITDRKLFKDNFSLFTAIENALKGGLKAVQLREKDLGTRELLPMAYRLREITNAYTAKLFINDRLDIALAVKADGVHLGQKSMPAHAVKKVVQDKLLIGVSTHNLNEAIEAERGGADFITLGPLYETSSKLKYGAPIGVDALRKVKPNVTIPVLGIGGITLDTVREVMDAGADGVALISGILASKNITETTEAFLRVLK